MQIFNLDLTEKRIIPLLFAKQGDIGRKFKVIITDGGAEYQIPADAAVSVWYSGASGNGNYTEIGEDRAVSVVKNEITVELITQMLTNGGPGALCLVINTADGEQLGMWSIPYMVESVPGMGSAAAEQYYTAFSKSAAEVAAAAKNFTIDKTLTVSGSPADAEETGRQISVERSRINQLAKLPEGSTTGDAELADARVGYDGTVYDNVGEAIRGQAASAIHFVVQNLTPEQKAQARENIDACTVKDVADKLCPSFTESGSVVTCEPVEGYPLTVQTAEGATKVTRCGKNLFSYDTLGEFRSVGGACEISAIDGGVRATTTRNTSGYSSVVGRWLPISLLDGKTITISMKVKKSAEALRPLFIVYYITADLTSTTRLKDIAPSEDMSITYTFTMNSASSQAIDRTHIAFAFYSNAGGTASAGDYVDYYDMQIEISDTTTDYEPYQGEEFNIGESIPALKGRNTIWADSGEISVTGKADPVAIISKLVATVEAITGV